MMLGNYTGMAVDFLDFWERQIEWSKETFGPMADRGPDGPLLHLAKEAIEARNETDKEKKIEEIADCQILTIEAAWRNGMSFRDLVSALNKKLAKNKARDWPKATAGNNPVEHQKTSSEARPKVVCLCGSTRFKQTWLDEDKRLTHEGVIVLTVGDMDPNHQGTSIPLDPEAKKRLDDLHKRKIDLADEVLVLNVGGYIGESTRSEIEYASAIGKPIKYLYPQECFRKKD